MADDGVPVTRAQYPRLYCHTDPPPDNLLYYTVLHCTVLYCTVPLYCHTDPASDNLLGAEQRSDSASAAAGLSHAAVGTSLILLHNSI